MIYRCNNKIYEGEKYSDVVNVLKKMDYDLPYDNIEYKRLVLERLKFNIIENLSDKDFIKGLEKLQVLKRIYRVFCNFEIKNNIADNDVMIDNVNYHVYLVGKKIFMELKKYYKYEYDSNLRGYIVK